MRISCAIVCWLLFASFLAHSMHSMHIGVNESQQHKKTPALILKREMSMLVRTRYWKRKWFFACFVLFCFDMLCCVLAAQEFQVWRWGLTLLSILLHFLSDDNRSGIAVCREKGNKVGGRQCEEWEREMTNSHACMHARIYENWVWINIKWNTCFIVAKIMMFKHVLKYLG